MTSISTISELLALSGSGFRVYDLGRRITKLSKEQFSKIEENQQPYPYPLQGHAYISVVFWQKKTEQTYMWFIKLPVDEKGLLNLGARNHFIAIIIEALGADLTVNPTTQQEELLKSNPYHFTPAQYKLASLNSMINVDVLKKSSQYYSGTKSYLSGEQSWDNWANIGVQGLADFAVRVNNAEHGNALAKAIPYLPAEVLTPLCSTLENQELPYPLIQAIIHKAQSEEHNSPLQTSLVRSLASSCQHPLVKGYLVDNILKQPIGEDMIIILSGRCWEIFDQEIILLSFLEKMALNKDEDLFLAIFKDLVAIPQIRPILLMCIRSTSRSAKLAQYIGLLFTSNSPKH